MDQRRLADIVGVYAPACANEWVRGVCGKPQVRCGDCPNQAFIPVTNDVIGCHLTGEDRRSDPDFVIVLTVPISWKGTLAQYVGRLHREHHAKREVIVYDYVDSGVAMLARMELKRQTGYRSLGYDLMLGSAFRVGIADVGELPATVRATDFSETDKTRRKTSVAECMCMALTALSRLGAVHNSPFHFVDNTCNFRRGFRTEERLQPLGAKSL